MTERVSSFLKESLNTYLTQKELPFHTLRNIFGLMVEGQVSDIYCAAFLTAFRATGETAEMLQAGAEILREHAVRLTDIPDKTIDTCGTGGDHSGTFNISTAVAFVVAAGGVAVAKHGNRSVSSQSGSADVLEKLGVPLDMTPQQASMALKNHNFCFLFAPHYHPAMKYVAATRKELGIRTIFNLLGPLSHPALLPYQLLGVFAKEWMPKMADVLQALGTKRFWVAHGRDGLDEITLTAPTDIIAFEGGAQKQFTLYPQDYGLTLCDTRDLKGRDADSNAARMIEILSGQEQSPLVDAICLNAAAAFYITEKRASVKEGLDHAKALIRSGKPIEILEKIKRL